MLYKEARSFVNRGIAVIPIKYRRKGPDFFRLKKVGAFHNKRPSWNPYKFPGGRLPTDEELRIWFRVPHVNLGVVCGWENLVVIDFDDAEFYKVCYRWAVQNDVYRTWNSTRMVSSQRGLHLYFKCENVLENLSLHWENRHVVDVKRTGYVLAPPSIHPSGAKYAGINKNIIEIPALEAVLPMDVFMVRRKIATFLPNAIKSPNPWVSGETYYDQIAQKVQVADVLGVSPPRGDRWMLTFCPFHEDDNASFWIDTERNKCGCHACDLKGPMDVIELYAEMHGLTAQAALEKLNENAH